MSTSSTAIRYSQYTCVSALVAHILPLIYADAECGVNDEYATYDGFGKWSAATYSPWVLLQNMVEYCGYMSYFTCSCCVAAAALTRRHAYLQCRGGWHSKACIFAVLWRVETWSAVVLVPSGNLGHKDTSEGEYGRRFEPSVTQCCGMCE